MPLTVDFKDEDYDNKLIASAGWHRVAVRGIPEVKEGKDSGNKYIEWKLGVMEGEFKNASLRIITTMVKGKRWMFSNMMRVCDIEKKDDKYVFELAILKGKEFYAKVEIKEEMYNGQLYEKAEVKRVAKELPKSLEVANENKEEEKLPF